MADDQQLWGYAEVAAHLGISVGAARNRKNRGTLPAPDDTSISDRPRWKPSTFQSWKPVGQGHRSDLLDNPATDTSS
ncbi:MarR family transcriptional regulator [Kitasatospora sp. NPDC001119]|uniref:MarR family transcriptional regulator n=1 Tax=Kitasatospora sp. MBT63 TaxID=1444768 RepID=UPI00053A5020|nr:MarR family transcriptional regulator [Kitasatospora sp. MBT63]